MIALERLDGTAQLWHVFVMHAAHDHSGHDHHHHGHGHGHVHAPVDFGRAFAIGIALNTAFVLVEAGYGYASGSMALVADAGHNLSDVLGLCLAWGAATLGKRPPAGRFTYGLGGSTILAALANAILLLIAVGAIAAEAVRRLFEPEPVAGWTMIIVAAIGIAINAATAMLFARGREHDLNIRGAYLHMAADAAVSAGVVVAGFAILGTGWTWLDPAVSLVIGALIAVGTWELLRDSVGMSLHAVPPGVDHDAVDRYLGKLRGVEAVHDLHIWAMSTTRTALTAHLVMPGGYPGDAFMKALTRDLTTHFRIDHPTVQIETEGHPGCAELH